mgnify:CR=1 FL=1
MEAKNGKDSIMESAGKIKRAFALDSIFMYHHTGESWERKIIIGDKDIVEDNDYLSDKAYIADFTEDGIEVIDNINFFERRAKIRLRHLLIWELTRLSRL